VTPWPTIRLADLATVERGLSWDRAAECSETDAMVNVVTIPSIKESLVLPGPTYLRDVPETKIARYGLKDGDILVIGSNGNRDRVGYCVAVVGDHPGVLFASFLLRVRPSPEAIDPGFLYFTFRNHAFMAGLRAESVGATSLTNLRITSLRDAPVPVPPAPTQRTIAAVLSAYDALIENNNRRIKILEEMAQRIYREWFVDFRYPGHEGVPLVDSELGPIPEGWRYEELSGVVDCIRDTVRPGIATVDDPYVPIDCIDAKSLSLGRWEPGENAKSSLLRFASRDILFGAMRPYFHKVAITPWSGTTRSTCFVLRPKDMDMWAFAVMTLFDDRTVDFATRHSSGSTIPYAKWAGAVADMPTLVPPAPIACAFGQVVGPILAFLTQAGVVNATLASARDLLLPRLVSGEIDVTDLDIAMPEAA
jgi:type I restriction enzyme S subunit